MAKAFEISQPYLSDLISGKKKPSLKLAGKIARATNGAVPMDSWHSAAGAAALLHGGTEQKAAA